MRFLSAAGEKSAILSLITARRSLVSAARVATGVNQSFSIEASFEEIRAEVSRQLGGSRVLAAFQSSISQPLPGDS